MASNDPTDTGGLFVGRRPGTAPLRYRGQPVRAGAARRAMDSWLAGLVLLIEILLCVSLWGPQPAGWLWVGAQVDYQTDSVSAGIGVAFLGMCFSLFLTLVLAKRVDHAWKLVRRAAGYEQERGALERIFVVTALIAVTAFCVWFFLIEGPGPSVSPKAPGEGP